MKSDLFVSVFVKAFSPPLRQRRVPTLSELPPSPMRQSKFFERLRSCWSVQRRKGRKIFCSLTSNSFLSGEHIIRCGHLRSRKMRSKSS